MKPKERVYQAISGHAPDRVPSVPKIWVDLGAALTGTELTEVISDPLRALEVIVEAGLLCGVDAVRQFHFPARTIKIEADRVLELNDRGEPIGEVDMQGGLTTRLYDQATFDIENPYYMSYHHFWSSEAPFVRDLSDAKRIIVPDKRFLVDLGWKERQETILKRYGGAVAFFGDCSSATMAFLVCLRGMERALMDLIENPELVHSIMEKGVAIAVEKAKLNLDMGIKILRLNDSVGNMSVISPAHWRTFVFPHMRDVCCAIHDYDKDAKVYCHICGNVLPIAEDLVETGLDCIGPLDPLGGLEPGQVRKRVGNAVSLMGGVNTLSFVQRKPEEVEQEARRCIRSAGQRGGFILGSGCVVPRSATRENLLALRRTVELYGVYDNGILKENPPF